MIPRYRSAFALFALVLTGLACGGSDGGTEPPPLPPVTVVISPASDTLSMGAARQLAATVDGVTSTQVTWSVVGGPAAGTVSAQGLFTAGSSPGRISVVATSIAQPVGHDTASILVVAAPSGVLSAADSATRDTPGLTASIATPVGTSFQWVVTGGTITAGQGTAGITYTAGSGSAVDLNCTITNLADSAVTLTGHTVLLVPPVITSFTALRDTVTVGQGTSVTAVFSGGTGTVDGGVGVVTSGSPVSVGPFNTGYAGSTLTLTVTGFPGLSQTAAVKIVSANPPVLTLFTAIDSIVPVGRGARLLLGWNQDPAVRVTVSGVGVVTTGQITTPPILTPGTTQLTMTVTSPADSVLTAQAAVTSVPPAPGAFTSTGSLHGGRAAPALVTLPGGRVLMVGGSDFTTPGPVTAEAYDPATGVLH